MLVGICFFSSTVGVWEGVDRQKFVRFCRQYELYSLYRTREDAYQDARISSLTCNTVREGVGSVN
jgi:hypothetical protein